MAVAKPVRALAVVSAVLFLYLIYQVFRTPPQINGPGDLEKALPNEPTLEGNVNTDDIMPWIALIANRNT